MITVLHCKHPSGCETTCYTDNFTEICSPS